MQAESYTEYGKKNAAAFFKTAANVIILLQ